MGEGLRYPLPAWPQLGDRVRVHRTVTKRYLPEDEVENYHANPSELVTVEHAPPIEGIAVGRTSLMTEDEDFHRRRHEFVGVRQTLRGRMHRVPLDAIEVIR